MEVIEFVCSWSIRSDQATILPQHAKPEAEMHRWVDDKGWAARRWWKLLEVAKQDDVYLWEGMVFDASIVDLILM